MARFSAHSRLDHVVFASPQLRVPSRASAVPLAAFVFSASLLPSKQARSLSSPENRAPAALKNDGIAAFRLWKQRARSQSIDHSAKREKRADRIAPPRDRANATRHAISPLPGRESVRNREFAMPSPHRAHGRSPPTRSRAHTIAETIRIDRVRSVVSPASRLAATNNEYRYAHTLPSSARAGARPSLLSANPWPAGSRSIFRPMRHN